MFNRRDFLSRTLGGSSLLAVGSVVPEFLAATARAADTDPKAKGKDTILVVVELTGGNDGLNTVAPYGDDLYHKARPTLAHTRKDVQKLDDYHGLHPRMGELKQLFDKKQLAVVQGVGYPNPDRSHFESMDIWQLADPRRAQTTGWLARSIPGMSVSDAGVPGMYIGQDRLPLAMQGADGGVISLADRESFHLKLTGNGPPRQKLLQDLNSGDDTQADLAAFVRKRQLQTYTSLKKIEEALAGVGGNTQPQPQPRRPVKGGGDNFDLNSLTGKLGLIGRLINKGLGTRLYYASLAGFDTHSGQAEQHADLLGEVSTSIGSFFTGLGAEAGRVVLVTYSEFGRRVKENGSRGTDHGAASCMFVAGPKVTGGIVGKHPKLDDLSDGDLKYHTDFRRVYATLLDGWLGVDSRGVLGEKFEPLPLIDRAKKVEPPGGPVPAKNGQKATSPALPPPPAAPAVKE
ncbi:MAG: hypothetical protein JWO38_7391 [Gemmataceae bacterium]|nr:hypothetical protein [Gemmataceae bacterium]